MSKHAREAEDSFLLEGVGEEKVVKRRLKRRIIPGADPNELIECIEKIKIPIPDWAFRLHTTSVFVAPCDSGKTNAVIRLAHAYQEHGSFNRIIVCSPTFESNEAFKLLHIRQEDIYSGNRVLKDGVGCVQEIEQKIKALAAEYTKYEQYVLAYRAWLRGEANANQETLLANNSFEEPEYIERPRILLILDDLSHTGIFSVSRANDFNNLLLRHRHVFGLGLSIFICVQTFTTGVPKHLRQNINQFFLWKTHDATQLKSIYEQVAQGCKKEEFLQAFAYATEIPHHFLTVDRRSKEHSVFRKNFNEELSFV